MRWLSRLTVGGYFLLATLPLVWMALTSFKTKDDAISLHPRLVPTLSAQEHATADDDRLTYPATTSAYRKLNEFEGRSSIKTWIYGIVFNVVRAQRRELDAKHPHALIDEGPSDPELLSDGADGPDERAAQREAARFLTDFLETLDDDRRDVFVLAELEQLSAPEIAAVVNAPLNTVYSRLRLARGEFTKAVARHQARDGWRNP